MCYNQCPHRWNGQTHWKCLPWCAAFANELSIICDKLDINVWELISLDNKHPRVNILQTGPGVGGHCIAVEPNIDCLTPEENFELVSLEEAGSSADIGVMLVDYVEFKRSERPNIEFIIDTKGIFGEF